MGYGVGNTVGRNAPMPRVLGAGGASNIRKGGVGVAARQRCLVKVGRVRNSGVGERRQKYVVWGKV